MKKTAFILILMLALGVPARSSNNWPTDNELLYKQMLEYVVSASNTIQGEPIYSQMQQLKLEIEAAHQSDKYAWIGQTLRFCNILESIYPPLMEHNAVMAEDRYQKIRRIFLTLKDYPMHVHSITDAADAGGAAPPAAQVSAFTAGNRQFFDFRRNGVLEYLKNVPRPDDGSIQVIKLYSSGFIFRTSNVCIGLDINYTEGMYASERRSELAQYFDAMFITHAHGDHYDKALMTELLKAGVPVVMTNDIPKDAPSEHKIIWDKDVLSPVQIIPGVSAQAKMAAQGTLPCLLFLIDCDGWRIAATGDNSLSDKYEFFHDRPVPDIVAAPISINMLLLNQNLHQATNEEGRTPVYLSAHENEWHHNLDGRMPFTKIYKNIYSSLDGNAMFTVVMDNGEIITLEK